MTLDHCIIFILELSLLSIILLIITSLPIRNLLKPLLIISITLKPSRLLRIHLLLFHKLLPIIIILLESSSSIKNRFISSIKIIITVLHSHIIFMLSLFIILLIMMSMLLVVIMSVILLLTATSTAIKLMMGVHYLNFHFSIIVTLMA